MQVWFQTEDKIWGVVRDWQTFSTKGQIHPVAFVAVY